MNEIKSGNHPMRIFVPADRPLTHAEINAARAHVYRSTVQRVEDQEQRTFCISIAGIFCVLIVALYFIVPVVESALLH